MKADDVQMLADEYVDLWNERDPARRRLAIEHLWTPDGTQRVTGSHEKNVRHAGCRFRAAKDAKILRDAASFHWEMIERRTERVAATGLEYLLLSADRKILVDYLFIVNYGRIHPAGQAGRKICRSTQRQPVYRRHEFDSGFNAERGKS
jgi:hypothetical protein